MPDVHRDSKLIQPLRDEVSSLYRRAYPKSTPQDAWSWRVRVVGKAYTKEWSVWDWHKAIRSLKQRLGIPLRRKKKDTETLKMDL